MPDPTTPPTTSGKPAEGALFPALYPSKDVTAAIEGLRSPLAGPALPPSTVATGQALPDQVAPAAAPEQPEQRIAVEDLGTVAGRRPRNAQERIAQLTRRYHEKADETTELRNQLAELRNMVASIPQQFNRAAASQAAPAPAQADPIGALLNGGATAPPPASSPSSPLDVARIVTEVLDSREQRQRAQFAEAERLRVAHVQSLDEAIEELPALRDQRTQAAATFRQLFTPNNPLFRLPDAPYQIALQVKGILADEARAQPTPTARMQASFAPTPSAVDTTGANRSAVQRDLEAAYAEMRSGRSDVDLHRRITGLKALLRSTQ